MYLIDRQLSPEPSSFIPSNQLHLIYQSWYLSYLKINLVPLQMNLASQQQAFDPRIELCPFSPCAVSGTKSKLDDDKI